MKCVRFNFNDLEHPKIARLSDEEAASWVGTGYWIYVPKKQYKDFLVSTSDKEFCKKYPIIK